MRNFTKASLLSALAIGLFGIAADGLPNALSSFVEGRSPLKADMIGSRKTQSANDAPSVSSLTSSFEGALSEGQIAKARAVLAELLQNSLSSDTLSEG